MIDVLTTREPEHVLQERGEHVPGLEVHERPDEVEAVGSRKRNDDVTESRVGTDQPALGIQRQEKAAERKDVLGEVFPACSSVGHSEVHGVACTPQRDDVAKTEEHDADRVRPFGTLRAVAERTDQDDEEQAEVELEEHFEDVRTRAVGDEGERVGVRIRGSRVDELCVYNTVSYAST